MSEAILRQDWLAQVEVAFEKLKAACTAERKEFCEVIREGHGAEAEAELKAKLAAHDQAMAAKLVELEAAEAEAVKPAEAPKAERSFILLETQPRIEESPKHTEPEATVPVSAEAEGWGRRRSGGEEEPTEKAEPTPEPEAAKPDEELAARAMLPAVIPKAAPLAPGWDDAVAAMNEHHAIIDNVGGKAAIACWEPSSIDPSKLVVVFQTKDSF